MAFSAEQSVSPQSACEFEFDVPHGVDPEEGMTREHGQIHDQENHDDNLEDILYTTEPNYDQHQHNQSSSEQELNQVSLPEGLSDDEDAEVAFDNSWTNHQGRISSSSNSKKSPRRSEDDGNDDQEASPRTKRPRQSLFGGPHEDDEQEQPGQQPVEQDDDMTNPNTPGQNIGYRISSLNLEQQDRDRSPSERPFNLGFGLASSNRASMSPRASPARSEDSVIIPLDTQVSDPSQI